MVTVALATAEQAPLVTALLTEASGWPAERGVGQWPHPFPEDVVLASVRGRNT